MASEVILVGALKAVGVRTLGKLLQDYQDKREDEAAKILLDEISQGFHGNVDIENAPQQHLLGMISRYRKAVADGAANENLRLLAQVILGLKKHRLFDDDNFRRWAGTLEQLTHDELLVVGFAYKILKKIKAPSQDKPANDFWEKLPPALQAVGFSQNEIASLCASISRTGLLIPASAFGGMAYNGSDWLLRLGDLANLEALAQEKRKSKA